MIKILITMIRNLLHDNLCIFHTNLKKYIKKKNHTLNYDVD